MSLLVAPLAACDSQADPPDPNPTTTAAGPAPKLTFGAVGAEDEIAAYTAVTESFDSLYEGARVELQSSPTPDALMQKLRSGEEVPDVFMVDRDDLAWLLEEDKVQPVDTLLDERGVDFGDGYSRDGLQAFSAEDRLQCMPYGISPMVMFYNTELVDFEKMEQRGLSVPQEPTDPRSRTMNWSFEDFAAAAEFASKPRQRTRGVQVEPTLESLSPFIHSGGGKVFDDEDAPTSLAFSDGETQDALEVALQVLRDPTLTLTEKQLEKASPMEWFERGKLGMVQGYRRQVPELRQIQGLEFDVLPMPVLDSSATVGEVTGLCLSADAENVPAAADLMVHLLSTPAVQRVVRAGYLVPANLEVALSDDFLQPGRLPAHSRRVQHQRPGDRVPAVADHLGRARAGRRAGPRPAAQPAGARRPRRADRGDRRGQPHRARPRRGDAERVRRVAATPPPARPARPGRSGRSGEPGPGLPRGSPRPAPARSGRSATGGRRTRRAGCARPR